MDLTKQSTLSDKMGCLELEKMGVAILLNKRHTMISYRMIKRRMIAAKALSTTFSLKVESLRLQMATK
jgi:hypothetical protein